MTKELRFFILNEAEENFFEIDEYAPKTLLLASDNIILIINDNTKTVWIWIGRDVSDKARFIAAKQAPNIRNVYAFSYVIKTADEGDEPKAWHYMIGTYIPEKNIDNNCYNFKIKQIDDDTIRGITIQDGRRGSIYIPYDKLEEFKKKLNLIKISNHKLNEMFYGDKTL